MLVGRAWQSRAVHIMTARMEREVVKDRRFITQHTVRRGKVSISAYLRATDICFRFKQRKNWGRSRETCTIINQSR
jgi:hypothetical protein